MDVSVSKIKFYYEVLGDTPEFIGEKLNVPPVKVKALAEQGGWQRQEMTEELVKSEFRKTREYLTLHEASRAKDLAFKFAELEDSAVTSLAKIFKDLSLEGNIDIAHASKALASLVSSLDKLVKSHNIYSESVMTAALADRKDEGLQENPLEALIAAMDGSGRQLPGQDGGK